MFCDNAVRSLGVMRDDNAIQRHEELFNYRIKLDIPFTRLLYPEKSPVNTSFVLCVPVCSFIL